MVVGAMNRTFGWWCAVPAAAAGIVLGQIAAPIGIVRGELVGWSGTVSRGDMQVRGSDGNVVTCGFDGKTYFEKDSQRIAPAAMAGGDRIEMVADRTPGATACYARTVHVIDPTVLRRAPNPRIRFREAPNPTEKFAPRGDLTFAGVVVRVNPDSLVLKTRAEGEKILLLRADTRYFGEGLRVEPGALQVRTRVFVRGGRNLDGDVEAYQIVWGEILQPR
jgi:hypothetical protein